MHESLDGKSVFRKITKFARAAGRSHCSTSAQRSWLDSQLRCLHSWLHTCSPFVAVSFSGQQHMLEQADIA